MGKKNTGLGVAEVTSETKISNCESFIYREGFVRGCLFKHKGQNKKWNALVTKYYTDKGVFETCAYDYLKMLVFYDLPLTDAQETFLRMFLGNTFAEGFVKGMECNSRLKFMEVVGEWFLWEKVVLGMIEQEKARLKLVMTASEPYLKPESDKPVLTETVVNELTVKPAAKKVGRPRKTEPKPEPRIAE